MRFAAILGLLLLASLGSAQDHPKPVRKPLPTAERIAALPADGGEEFNRLVFSQSPYLLQHARNPVDWWPWDEEAFEAAAETGKPVFLSIGYSTCHWCHVMEHESFEDPAIAALMNDAFINIKVDREERPDVDHVYMTVTQAMTGRGGWPMTVILTPDKRPFFAGTYFPKDQLGQRPGMRQLIPSIEKAWKERQEDVLAEASRITDYLAQVSRGKPGEQLGEPALLACEQQLSARYDSDLGGFSQAPKFPIPHNLRFLLRHHARTGSKQTLEQVTNTLRQMRLGGIWDHVGFGFHRYSTDRRWLVPHFEKMLYDQALLAMAYTEGWQVSGDALFRQTVDEIFTYVLRDMTDPGGGFYSAEDADSEGEEGLFYLWTTEQLEHALGPEDGALAAQIWNAAPGGNFRDEATGKQGPRNILHLSGTLDEAAARLEVEPGALAARLEAMRTKLFAVREPRIHPLKDDKVLTDWNGLMIAALARAGRAMGEERYLAAAVRAADFAQATLRDPETGRLFKRWRQGEAGLDGLLEDYAFLAWGMLELFEATQDPRWLGWAKELCDLVETHFAADGGGYYLSPHDGEQLIVRAQEAYDGAIPSGNSVMALNLVRLARLTGDMDYEARAQAVVRAFSGQVGANPPAFTQMLMALDFLVGPSHEVIVAGERGDPATTALMDALSSRFLPRAVTLLADPATAEALAALAPYTQAYGAEGQDPAAYVCSEFTCKAPVEDPEAMLRNLLPGGG